MGDMVNYSSQHSSQSQLMGDMELIMAEHLADWKINSNGRYGEQSTIECL